jgi:cell division protein FtsQ
MGAYQGRALQAHRRPRRPGGLVRRVVRVLALALALVVLAHVPWQALRRRFAVVTEVRVEGAHYLDAGRIAALSGLKPGDDLFGIDLARARQALLLDSRVAHAEVARRLPRGVRLRVGERIPVLLVHHGAPWEIDSAGVLLAPLQRGVVADVPLLVGPRFEGVPAGAHVRGIGVERGLAWVHALSDRELQLAGDVSEIDVSSELATSLTLLSGTRVLAPAYPPSIRRLSALRVVLADLGRKGMAADEVDVRFENQVIVRPPEAPGDSRKG